jgi:hypothetical protein
VSNGNPTYRLTRSYAWFSLLSLSGLLILAAAATARLGQQPVAGAPLPAFFSTLIFLTQAPASTPRPSRTPIPSSTLTPRPTWTPGDTATGRPSGNVTPGATQTAPPIPTLASIATNTLAPRATPSATSPPATQALTTVGPTRTLPPTSSALPTASRPPNTQAPPPASPTSSPAPPPNPTGIAPPANTFWGVNGGPIDGGDGATPFDGNLSHNAPLRAKSFYWMARAGLSWFRNYASDGIDTSWRFVEPAPGQFNWSTWDLLAVEAQRQSISLLAEIGNSVPAWASGSVNWRDKPLDLYAEPMAASSWYRFVNSMVERYDGDGQADMPGLARPIKYWEIWNEPDLRQGWNPPDHPAHQFNGTAADAVRLLQVAYAAVKAADPGATVVGPASAQTPGDAPNANWFLWNWSDFVNAGGLAYVDVVSFHHYYTGYDYDTGGGLDALLAQVDAHRGGKPVWITEMGWAGDPAAGSLLKARSFVRSMAIAWSRPFVGRYFWYSFHESETFETSDHRGFIQTLNGSAARGAEPDPLFHPVYQAAAVMSQVLAGFEAGDHPAALEVGSAARAFHLSKNGDEVWLAWHRAEAGNSVINLDTGGRTVRVIGLFGEDLGTFAGGALTVGASPVYLTTRLDWNPNVGHIAGRLRDGSRANEWGNGVAGAVVELTGPVSASTVTDADGNYLFEALPEGVYTVRVLSHPAVPESWTVTVTRQGAWGRTSFMVPVAISPR